MAQGVTAAAAAAATAEHQPYPATGTHRLLCYLPPHPQPSTHKFLFALDTHRLSLPLLLSTSADCVIAGAYSADTGLQSLCQHAHQPPLRLCTTHSACIRHTAPHRRPHMPPPPAGRVIAGAYPASLDDTETHQLLSLLLELGVNTFVCLQAEVNIHIPGDTCSSSSCTAVVRQQYDNTSVYSSCGTICAVSASSQVQTANCKQ